MRLSGYSSIYNGFGGGAFPPSVRRGGSSFLDEMQKATAAASAEKVKDVLERSGREEEMKALYDRLSPAAKDVLERLNSGKEDIKKEEWRDLCQELKDAGAISQSDFDYTRSDLHFIPIGYEDENGNFVQYDTPPMLKDKLLELRDKSQKPLAGGLETIWTPDDWTGNPLEYLDAWAKELYDWRSDLARTRAEDGSLKYNNFDPINRQIDACNRVSALVKELGKF